MDGSLGSATIQPEQMFIISPFMILFLVPLMDKFIFPLLNKNGLFLTPLKKIGFGGFLAALAFVIAGIVELNVEVYTQIIKSNYRYPISFFARAFYLCSQPTLLFLKKVLRH